jgi:hypothetical protein
MRFELTAVAWLLLNASASSFGTQSASSLASRTKTTFVPRSATSLSFVRGGGTSSTALSAAVAEATSAANLEVLSERGRLAVLKLIESDVDGSQRHVYGNWPEPGTQDEDKQRLAEQVCFTHINYMRPKLPQIRRQYLTPVVFISLSSTSWLTWKAPIREV